MQLSAISLAITRQGAPKRSPLSLWPTGTEPGLWISPRSTSASYQDSSGTRALSTIGTVADSSNPVGVILDKRFGGFIPLPGTWSKVSGDGAVSVVGNVITITGATTQTRVDFTASTAKIFNSLYRMTNQVSGSPTTPEVFLDGVPVPLNSTSTVGMVGGVIIVRIASGDAVFTMSTIEQWVGTHLTQATSTARPFCSARKNVLVGTATLSTQSVTTIAAPYTMQFAGAGTVTASGTYVGALTNGQTFTPTAGTLTLTVSGSVTSAQLALGSTVSAYQDVVSDSSYTADPIVYDLFDGVDDGWLSGTVAAGVIGNSNMDCLIAVRRDSGASVILCMFDAGNYFGYAVNGGAGASITGVPAATVWVDNVQLSGGTSVTTGTLHTALTMGVWHIVEFRGLNLSTWTSFGFSKYSSIQLTGALGGDGIMLFPSTTAANRDKARTALAASVGLVL